VELYHPLTGEPYGGLKENPTTGTITLWEACQRQTWCATGYIHMVLTVLLGLRFSPEGITFAPHLPAETAQMRLGGLRYRDAVLDITIERGEGGDRADPSERAVPGAPVLWQNGTRQDRMFLPSTAAGEQTLRLVAP
jgi:hypothetical protein